MQDRQHAGQMREEFLRAMMAASLAAELGAPPAGGVVHRRLLFQNLGRMLCSFYFAEEAAQIRASRGGGHRTEGGGCPAGAGAGAGRPGRWRGAGLGPARNLAALHPQTPGRLPTARPERGCGPALAGAGGQQKWPRPSCRRMPQQVGRSPARAGFGMVAHLALSAQAFADATLRARQQLVALAQALDLRVAPDSAAACCACLRPGGG